jgi:hypothetical protein
MFVCAAVVIGLNIWDRCHPESWWPYRALYLLSLSAMAAGVAVIVPIHLWGGWQNHWLFWFEFSEITPFTIFWAAQTTHLWGRPTRDVLAATTASRRDLHAPSKETETLLPPVT